ncbi:MAG: NDP-sugar synthase [Candidatus Bathyarchaeia archaeon]
MKAVVLAGGFATRLRPLSCTRPKILFPIVNKPLLEWIFEGLAKNGVDEVVMAVNCQTEIVLKQHRVQKCGMRIIYSCDPPRKPLGTGGPIKKVEKSIGHGGSFLVLNGDIFADVNYREILKVHEEKDAVATIVLYYVEDPSRYGVVELANDNRIKRFVEKPRREDAPTNLINAGIYIFSPEIFKYIPEGRMVSTEREVFPKLVEEGKLYGYVHDGLWMDIGKPEDYLKINRILLNSISAYQKFKAGGEVKINKPVAFDRNVFVGEKSVIGPYTVLGRDVTVGNNVSICDSVVFPETEISDFASLESAIIGEGVFIGRRVKVGKGCVIGDYVKVGDGVTLGDGVLVCPSKEVNGETSTIKCII